jgi:glycosyltransferase involved in cell wall biosynthesis
VETLVCISHLRWDFVWQRPQHLLSRFAKRYKVLFVEEPVTSDGVAEPRLEVVQGKGAPNVTVIRLLQPAQGNPRWIGHSDPVTQEIYGRLLAEYLKAQDVDSASILWLYTPMASDFIPVIPHDLLIFDVMDQLSAFKGAPAELVERDQKLLKQADIVLTGGASLYRDKQPYNPNTYLFPSGVEPEHFAKAARREDFERPDELRDVASPIIGYYGVIDERMDIALIAEVAQKRPDWNFVLIGPVVKISPDDLPKAPNLHYPGMKTYEELPAYLAHFDIALIPFAMNEATRFLSPTKTLEYMAAHKPIISTPINDVIELYGAVVRVINNADEFIQQVEDILNNPDDGETRRATEQELLARYTWDSIAEHMQQIIDEVGDKAAKSAA